MRTMILCLLLASCFALTACDTSVNVAATANVDARYSSVRITVKELWVNQNATASIDDTTWLKFPLSTPVTFDLVELTSGTLNDFATQLKVPPGSYRQVRLFLVDRTEALTSSAQSAGAAYNDEVTYFDANNAQNTVPLEIPNAAQGIGIETELTVEAPTDAILAALGSAPTSGTALTMGSGGLPTGNGLPAGSGLSTGSGVPGSTALPRGTGVPTDTGVPAGTSVPSDTGLPTGTSPTPGTDFNFGDTTNTDTTTPAPVDTTTTTVTGQGLIVFDAHRDLTPFLFGDQPGFLLNPSLSAHDARKVGTIQGALDLSLLAIDSGAGRPNIEVTAETLNDDSTRRVEVASTPVTAEGAFTLYPLPLEASKSTTTYDLVIHGPAIQTVIIRDVPVAKGPPSSGSAAALGTITLSPSDSYVANVAADSPASPPGARVGFYQTLPDDSAPYLIDQQPVDPLSGRLATAATLSSSATIAFGTFGGPFVAAAPQEGESKYSVAALSPFYGNGAFSNALLAPPAAATDVAPFTVPEVQIPSNAASGTISAVLSAATPGKYDKGVLLVTHDGAVITTVSLDQALAGSAGSTTVNITNVPASNGAGFDRGLYYLEAWTWNSADPKGTFTRQPTTTAVDLRSTLSANADVAIN